MVKLSSEHDLFHHPPRGKNLRKLIVAYLDPTQGFTARRMMEKVVFAGEFDHLARFGEWDGSDPARPEDLT
jgi:hypothetical protein